MTTTIAESITRAASKQTYYTIRFLVDRERVMTPIWRMHTAGWTILDAESLPGGAKRLRPAAEVLLESCYQRGSRDASIQEKMLVS
jgi:hypothetical protein